MSLLNILNDLIGLLKRLIQIFRLRAASLGHIRPAASAAAHR